MQSFEYYLKLVLNCIIEANHYIIKANHLVYAEQCWNGSQISADCQQKLFLSEYDTGGRFLLVTFLGKEK